MKIKNCLMLVITAMLGVSLSMSAQVTPQSQQAQPADFSDETLMEFVEASKDINQIQRDGQQEMQTTIKKEGLDMETYRQISASQRNPEKESEASEQEMASFNKANEKVQKLRMDMQKDMQEAIGNHDITVQEYRQVMQAYRSNPELKKKIDDMMAQSQ